MKISLMVSGLLLIGLSVVYAAEETSAIAAPKCDAAKVKVLGGEGVLKVEKGAWVGSYRVTIDTTKMSSADMVRTLYAAGCM